MKWNGWCPSHASNIGHQGHCGGFCGHLGDWHKGCWYLRSGRSLNTRPAQSRTLYNSDILFLPIVITYYSAILFPFVSLDVWAYLLRKTTILRVLLLESDMLLLWCSSKLLTHFIIRCTNGDRLAESCHLCILHIWNLVDSINTDYSAKTNNNSKKNNSNQKCDSEVSRLSDHFAIAS